jgi:hypothetical protein
LDLCWEEGWLRWYDPAVRQYLRTHDEEAEAGIAVLDERDAERRSRLTALEERDAALDERDVERAARLAAEERMREMEAEIRRLRS